MIADLPKLPARCDACGYEVPYRQIPRAEYFALLDGHYLRGFTEELRMLELVDDFRSRQLAQGIPFDKPEWPFQIQPEKYPDDHEVVDYLNRSCLTLDLVRRFEFVRNRIGQLRKTVRVLHCAECGDGVLELVEDSRPNGAAGPVAV